MSISHFIFNKDPFYLITLCLLLILSLLSWTLILKLFFIFRKENKETNILLKKISSLSLQYFQKLLARYSNLALSQAIQACYSELKYSLENEQINKDNLLEQIDNNLAIYINLETRKLSQSLPILASISASAPFIGLFGTVAGMIRALYHIGDMQNAQLNIIAPDVAAALIATAAGLFVAIPALLAFNYFRNKEQHLLTTINRKLFSVQSSLHLLLHEITSK